MLGSEDIFNFLMSIRLDWIETAGINVVCVCVCVGWMTHVEGLDGVYEECSCVEWCRGLDSS